MPFRPEKLASHLWNTFLFRGEGHRTCLPAPASVHSYRVPCEGRKNAKARGDTSCHIFSHSSYVKFPIRQQLLRVTGSLPKIERIPASRRGRWAQKCVLCPAPEEAEAEALEWKSMSPGPSAGWQVVTPAPCTLSRVKTPLQAGPVPDQGPGQWPLGNRESGEQCLRGRWQATGIKVRNIRGHRPLHSTPLPPPDGTTIGQVLGTNTLLLAQLHFSAFEDNKRKAAGTAQRIGFNMMKGGRCNIVS